MASARQIAWLKTMVAPAQLSQKRWSVPASISLAQCILESAWGQSQLARRCNNYFGVKAVAGQDYCEFPTQEIYEGRRVTELAKFARYPSAIESFEAHARLLATSSRYARVMRAAKRESIWAAMVQLYQCGYSTNPQYPDQLRALIAQFDLTQYDIDGPADPGGIKEVA